MDKSEIIICDCHSTEHQLVFHYDDEYFGEEEIDDLVDPFVYLHIHLNKRPFWKRLKYGIKYIFGHTSRYGAFDEVLFNTKDISKFEDIVKYLKLVEMKQRSKKLVNEWSKKETL